MNKVKIILLTVFAFATPLVMFYQGYVIAGKEKLISDKDNKLAAAVSDSSRNHLEKQNDSLRVELKCLDTIRAIENRWRAASVPMGGSGGNTTTRQNPAEPSPAQLIMALGNAYKSLNRFVDNLAMKTYLEYQDSAFSRHLVPVTIADYNQTIDTIQALRYELKNKLVNPAESKREILLDLNALRSAVNQIDVNRSFINIYSEFHRNITNNRYYK